MVEFREGGICKAASQRMEDDLKVFGTLTTSRTAPFLLEYMRQVHASQDQMVFVQSLSKFFTQGQLEWLRRPA